MQVEVGKIYEGKVTGITKFGAFVDIGENTTGMVHISEVSSTFVNDINDCLEMGQTVKVKVIKIENGKIGMSIKRAQDRPNRERKFPPKNSGAPQRGAARPKPSHNEPSFGSGVVAGPSSNSDFEDMLNKFKAVSEERMSDLKHITENKRRSGSRRK